MTTKTKPKKTWQAPQIFDLDVNSTKSGVATAYVESSWSPTFTSCAPSS